ncbi:translation factor Sua5 [Arsukibacterium sp. MJ3]|uniref:L-threonylcarbamoyladenylate synthase n=1 Tax=Arsukibacterium sp. MJ3 TaxID=1632859 RepID=UPI0006272718|nr:L-threonylcarbamoyladenylate synthase [Arsukibacterium sp. MJ3]KKO49514.1 translation factor Sua5 [Arsukibacterium sp. MJ3]
MNTLLLNANNAADVDLCARLLQQGQLVAVPTETVYGLAADASNPAAVSAIFSAKGRPANHPLIVHVAHKSALSQWAKNIGPDAHALVEAFWPGPLTLLLAKADHVSSLITGGLSTIGLRMPAHPVLLALLQQHQLALAAPSANPYKKLSPTSAAQVMAGLQGKISAVLDGGVCQFGLESTIVDVTGEQPTILRAGPITASDIASVLGRPVAQPAQHNVAVSGNVKAHYQPNKPLSCFSRAELLLRLPQLTQKIMLLQLTELPQVALASHIVMPTDAAGYAHRLYQTLFAADQHDIAAIWCELPPKSDQWLAVHDRLQRASFAG